MSALPRVTLHGGPADGTTLPVSRLTEGIIVQGALYQPPATPAPYYPHWYFEPARA